MARRSIPLIAAVLLILIAVGPASAADGCPAAASGFRAGAVDWDWELGVDLVPASGDLLWDITVVAGALAEGLTTQQLAALLGFTDTADFTATEQLYEFVLEGWRGLDKNEDGAICFKALPPHQNGLPAYISNFVDTNANAAR